ncbi:MAG: HEAT repeat domain-containing protein [Chloroflexota bacterium]|nr:HEAT repeat domain-containing protein [Chloroflexota bacterium]
MADDAPALVADLQWRLATVAHAADRQLLRAGLLDALTHPALKVRALAAAGLGRIGDERTVVPLLHALHDPAPLVQWQAAHALRALHHYGLVSAERLSFQDDRRFEQWKAARLEDLRAQLTHDLGAGRAEAAYSLAAVGAAIALPWLLDALADEDATVRAAVAEAVLTLVAADAALYEPAHQGSSRLLSHGDPDWRCTAADLLGRLGRRAAVPDLLPLLHDADAGVRWCVCTALGAIGDPRSVDPLMGRLADDDPWVRRGSADALGRLGDPYAVPALLQLISDEQPLVRQGVISALAGICGPAVGPALIRALGDPDTATRLLVVQALAAIGDAAALRPLAALVRDRAMIGTTTVGHAARAARQAIRQRLDRKE